MINELRVKVREFLNCNLDNKQLIKYMAISKILDDDYCFFKMSINDAFSILMDLGYNDIEIERIYKCMLSSDNYKKLIDL